MNRLHHIRSEEKKYHDYCYDQYKLFEQGSWLYKPVQTVIDLLPLIEKDHPRVLDLGCGVGRNSIPIAQAVKAYNGKVICVDLLNSAIEKLDQYRKMYDVEEEIELHQEDIGQYQIIRNEYDLILAVSALEHTASETEFEQALRQMAAGTKQGGINCLIVNSSMEEIDLTTGDNLEVLLEVNLSTAEMMSKLERIYDGWEVLRQVVKPLEYEIVRGERKILLKTSAITYVARRESND
ncbi:class I SAM-dependent methyltransferase [Jeotgalibacillus terrae]|uniref:Class I SAM-dependent methyltransferase n=1 Tax=Jeotgalibacillus terrae TaxID=587735 RepID=A0ABW5ZH89_9BACL|nr:class I SAM-dependent methyltransferase [Jeotgalibacillus terrae]MBM7578653.1 2-polyprenyl-3-methyl-5-hydroxy-6-metoxy-1,4-benzoquinol methylase [Jeotgalibacillus terrae]